MQGEEGLHTDLADLRKKKNPVLEPVFLSSILKGCFLFGPFYPVNGTDDFGEEDRGKLM